MAELTLLVNSTDTALLNGSAVSPVAPSSTAADSARAGGFAGVLSKQLMPSEGTVATESPPVSVEPQNTQAPVNGEPLPLNGKALPLATSQNTVDTKSNRPVMDASLLLAIAQASPSTTGQSSHGLESNASPLLAGSSLVKPGGSILSTLPQHTMAQTADKSGLPTQLTNPNSLQTSVLQQTTNLPVMKSVESSATTALSNATQDAQRSVVTPVIPALLGKPISATAEQALARLRHATGTANYSRAETLPVARLATANSQNSPLSNMSAGINNLMGSTTRIDIFNTAMSVTTQSRAEQYLATNPATATPATLAATPTLPDSVINLSADAPRLPGITGTGFSTTLAVPTPVGQPAWASEMGQRVTWLANSELREAQLQLNPRSLGAVDVRIAYGPEQQLNVSFTVTNPIARDALEASLPRLREMFEQQGLNLASTNISQDSSEKDGHRNNMNDELPDRTVLRESNEELSNEVDTYQSPLHWLSEGMLDAYA